MDEPIEPATPMEVAMGCIKLGAALFGDNVRHAMAAAIEARDSEWRSRLDVVETRLEVARKALERFAKAGDQGSDDDVDDVLRVAARALTETASTPSPGATPGKE